MRLRHVIVEFLLKARGEGERFRLYREFSDTQYLSHGEIRRLQLMRLQNLTKHARDSCEFYRARFQSCGFDPQNFTDFMGFAAIPPLEKADIQGNCHQIVAAHRPSDDLIENFTGGSTGQPLRLFYNRMRHESRIAATMRHDEWAGRRLGSRVAFLWGAPTDFPRQTLRSRVRRWLEGPQLWLNAGNLRVSEFSEFNERLRRFRPAVILAYANSLSLFARFLNENKLATCTPNSVITSAEILTDDSRKLIERTFGCQVFNRYGCREVSVIASECENHSGMHVMAEGLYVEIVDKDGRPVPEGETGEILITDLLNYGMPMIRYRIGDRGAWASGECQCGRGLPRLRFVAGRVTDFVVGADSQLVSGVFLATYVVARRPSLGRVQIVQSRIGHVLFRVCPGKGFEMQRERDYLFSEMRKYVGPLHMDIAVMDDIPPEPSGKMLFCKSEVASSGNPTAIYDGAMQMQLDEHEPI